MLLWSTKTIQTNAISSCLHFVHLHLDENHCNHCYINVQSGFTVYDKWRFHEDCVCVWNAHTVYGMVWRATGWVGLRSDEVLRMHRALHIHQTSPSSFLLHSFCHALSTDLSMIPNKSVAFDKFVEWEWSGWYIKQLVHYRNGVHCNCNRSSVSLCVDGGKWSLQSELHAYCLDGSPS